jgi:hypothetical protein
MTYAKRRENPILLIKLTAIACISQTDIDLMVRLGPRLAPNSRPNEFT